MNTASFGTSEGRGRTPVHEALTVDAQIRAIEPLAMFHSRSLQGDYSAARRYDESEVE